jgi:uncharacterized membrane protein YjjB (DUF3815 family)
MDWTYFLPCLWAFLACAGFCVIFNVRTGVVICCVGGALGWLVYLLTALTGGADLLCYFLAAMAISVYSEIMARVRKCPVTGYLLISCFPLVPGAGIYYTMEYAIQGNTELFLEQGLHTLGIACCLAVGVLVVSSAVRMASTFRANRRKP